MKPANRPPHGTTHTKDQHKHKHDHDHDHDHTHAPRLTLYYTVLLTNIHGIHASQNIIQ